MPTVTRPSAGEQIIPVKNPQALFAYYCAIFGLIPCFTPILGPASLILGLLARRAIRSNAALPGLAHAWLGIALGGIQTLLGLALAIALLHDVLIGAL